MNKFILIPYDQHASFKSYLMKKDHDLSSDKEESEVIADSEDAEKNLINNKLNISKNSEKDTLNEKDSSGDILDKNKEEISDNLSDRLLPPPGIPVKRKKTEKVFQYGFKGEREGAGTRSEPKWVKKWQRKII